MEIKMPGKPIAKKRPRFARRGKFVTTYSAQETEEGKAYLICKEQIPAMLSGALSVDMMFWFQRPKSHYKKSGALTSAARFYHDQKPDLDNLIKFYCDVLNGKYILLVANQ